MVELGFYGNLFLGVKDAYFNFYIIGLVFNDYILNFLKLLIIRRKFIKYEIYFVFFIFMNLLLMFFSF